jgi:hypothetical protein
MDMLCLMHDGQPYGHLVSKGTPVTMRLLAIVAGITEAEATALVAELEAAQVFNRTPEGVIYSRRMVRDFEQYMRASEYGKSGWIQCDTDTHKATHMGTQMGTHKAQEAKKLRSKKLRGSNPRIENLEKKEILRTVPLPNAEPKTVADAPPALGLFGEDLPPAKPQPLPKRPKVVAARTRIPADWKPDDAGVAFARDRGVAIPNETQRFIDHHQAKGSLMADWKAAWRTWCGMAVQFGRAPGKATDKPANPNEWIPTPMSGAL